MRKDTITTLKIAGLLLALFTVYLFKGLLVQPPKVDANHEFNTERAYARLTRILGDETPHPVDSDAGDAVIARLITEIETLGFTPLMRDQFHCVESWRSARCARLQNVAFWVTDPGPNAVLLLSHHDSVPAGPGASDDGAGVAASLEIAKLLKGDNLNRPLLVLMTDGEEPGLIGANLFVAQDPLAKMVGAVVNMEARGIRGLTTFFQTSNPNSRDLKALLGGSTRLPLASSMSADIYELLPNDTDLTEFLPLPIDAVNLAYTDGVAFYHTSGDNLANMDQRALFHLGASGLTATKALLAQTQTKAETQIIYVDILGVFVIAMPAITGAVIIMLSGLLASLLLWKIRKTTRLWRVLLAPLLALGLGIGLAIVMTLLVKVMRPEQFFGSAYPIALRGLHASSGLTGAMIIYTFMTRSGEAKALLASAWLWISLLGLITFFTVQGGAIIFAPPLALFSIAAIGLWLDKPVIGFVFASLGSGLSALILAPAGAVGEISLFIESSAPFAIIVGLLFIFTAPLIWPKEDNLFRAFWPSLVGTGAVMVVCFVASLLVPAYSHDAPRRLSITHIDSTSLDGPIWRIPGTQPAPETFSEVASFAPSNISLFGGPGQSAPAPQSPLSFKAQIISDRVDGPTRTLTLAANSLQTDRFIITFSGVKQMSAIRLNGVTIPMPDTVKTLICNGRACRDLEATFSFPAKSDPLVLDIMSQQFGLGPESAALIAARPASIIPQQSGDSRIQHMQVISVP